MLLNAWGTGDRAEGSPTFAIAHEYSSTLGEVIHLDLYRLHSDLEVEEAGVLDYFWGRQAIVLAEWVSQFQGLEVRLHQDQSHKKWVVLLGYVKDQPQARRVEITQLS